MSELRGREEYGVFNHERAERQSGSTALRRTDSGGGSSTGWLLAGVAVLALGALAAYHFGPDVRRYIKMEMM